MAVWAILLMLFIMPAIVFPVGFYMHKTGRGFETEKGWKNPQLKAFAGHFCGRAILRLMPLYMGITVAAAVMSIIWRENETLVFWITVGTTIGPQTLLMLVPVISTHKAIKRNFDDDGNPKS